MKKTIFFAIATLSAAVFAESFIPKRLAEGRQPVFTGDGKQIVYRVDKTDGTPELRILSVDNPENARSLQIEGVNPACAKNEKGVLFMGNGIFPELFLLNPATGETIQLETSDFPSGTPFQLDAQNHLWAFPVGFDTPPAYGVVNIQTRQEITEGKPDIIPETLAISPNRQYAVMMKHTGGTNNFAIIDLKAPGHPVLYETQAANRGMQIGGCHSPAFSPDGKRLVFITADIQPSADIMLLDIAEKKVTPLTTNHSDNQSPSFSPDGKNILFSALSNGKYQIFLLKAPAIENHSPL